MGKSKMGILQMAKLRHMGPAWRMPDLARKHDAALPSSRGAAPSTSSPLVDFTATKQSLSCLIEIAVTLCCYGNPSWLRQPFGLLGPLMRATKELGAARFGKRGYKLRSFFLS